MCYETDEFRNTDLKIVKINEKLRKMSEITFISKGFTNNV